MFDKITEKFSTVFRSLRGLGKITETNIQTTVRDVRIILLDADVNYNIVKSFIEKVKIRAEGTKVIKSIKPGDLMTGSMSKDASVEWFGVAPPDLTLVSRVRGDDWIYSYLRAYYEDSSKQYGVNNLVYPGTAMPNVLMALQGSQKLICKNIPIIAGNGGEKRDQAGKALTKEKCGFLEVPEGSGQLTKDEFDKVIYDLTNFLVYVGEPSKATRERIGWYVIFYFLIFTAVSYMLYREYHKDYH